MSVSSDAQVDINACLDAVSQAFKDGGAIIEKIKKKRALKRAPPPPRLLEESIDQAPAEIERERKRGINRFGKAFEEGDHIAVISLQQITIQLQSSLLEKLRNAAFDDDTKITDFTYLVDAADVGRDRTIAALHEFKQRLINSQNVDQQQQQKPQDTARTTPTSSTSNVGIPPPEPTRSQTMQVLSNSQPKDAQPSKHRTWTREYSLSREASGEEDAAPGATEEQHFPHHRKRSSLLHFLKHNRTHSSEAKDKEKDKDKHTLHTQVEEPHSRAASTAPTSVPFRPPPQCDVSSSDIHNPNYSQAKFRYEEWEDNPSEIWGSKTSLERRETMPVAPDQGQNPNMSSSYVGQPLQPPSPVMTNRSNSNPHTHAHQSTAVPTPNPDNDFLGFCKGAWKLQNGDRKGSMHKCREVEAWSRHPSNSNASSFLACQTPRCAFRSNFANPNVDVIWNKVFTAEAKGIKIRWPFLAKSHVTQKVVVKHQYSFKCLFCVFTRGSSGVYHGMEYYLDHICQEHRGTNLGDVVLYRTGCINDRIATEEDEFDINLYPVTAGSNAAAGDRRETYLNDDLLDGYWNKNEDKNDSMFGANEPWNEGLSDFHYGGDFDGNELE
ncbi:hypothetical protein PRZ48_011791 [Zasmidium cellare]|uniref:Uncharacterized protein n=1 Tax=Zasmidium cellare TaxID=395010 RepID=A0ABR0E7J8_ZASCE|nr:hypothetical protein PRZ48_011791 [Zasmidium cellare]